MQNPLVRNQVITLGIDSLSSEGQGVGRFNDVVVFVPFALPGEEIKARIVKPYPSYAIGKLVEVKRGAPGRVEPLCPVFGRCGGCQLQHLDYDAQLLAKRRIVVDALVRLGGLTSVAEALVSEPVGGEPYGYRNKGSFPVREENGAAAAGLFAQRSHRLIPVESCPIARGEVNAALKGVSGWLRDARVKAYDEQRHSAGVRHIVIRSAKSGVMAAVVTKGPLQKQAELIEALRGKANCAVHNENAERTNTVLGERSEVIFGETLVEELNGLSFAVSDKSFLQVNSKQAEKLYALVSDALELTGGETVLDAYCGVGTIALTLSARCKSVIGMEIVPEAVSDARENAARNAITNAEFHCGPAERLLPELVLQGTRFDALVLDPPRKGCDEGLLKAALSSGAGKIVYVSCNPATLARDAKLLCEGGFELVRVTPVDMFPQSAHVECVAVFYGNETNANR